MKSRSLYLIVVLIGLSGCASGEKTPFTGMHPTRDDGTWFFLQAGDLTHGSHHTAHDRILGRYVTGYNSYILKGIDIVQSTAPDGGGYFAQLNADPPEAPIGYALTFLGKPLIRPARTTSYCSGSTFSAFIEGMNLLLQNRHPELDDLHHEALRMQEPDGGRREDGVKFWGHWNADGYGNHYALVQYTDIGDSLLPQQARPGDFMNISWRHGGGHSVIFLGWYTDENDSLSVVYWSSQKGTNGLGDDRVPVARIKEVKTVRVTRPENLFSFNPSQPVMPDISGEPILPR